MSTHNIHYQYKEENQLKLSQTQCTIMSEAMGFSFVWGSGTSSE